MWWWKNKIRRKALNAQTCKGGVRAEKFWGRRGSKINWVPFVEKIYFFFFGVLCLGGILPFKREKGS